MIKILAGTVLFLSCSFNGKAQTDTSAAADPWQQYMTPSETHRFLAQYEGTWTEEVDIFSNAAEEPQKFTFTAVINMILGGRYQQITQTGEMAGLSFEGWTTLGYSNADHQFTLTAINTIGTGTLVLEGRWKEPEQTIVLEGSLSNPADKTPVQLQQVITFIDKDNFEIVNYDTKGKEAPFRSMVYKFSRQ